LRNLPLGGKGWGLRIHQSKKKNKKTPRVRWGDQQREVHTEKKEDGGKGGFKRRHERQFWNVGPMEDLSMT